MNDIFIIGLTGSIGMGKSTTAKLFQDLGVSVWDADSAVHRLYEKGGVAVEPISKLCPDAIVDGAVDRARLKTLIENKKVSLSELNKIVHPLVARDRALFLEQCKMPIALLDMPLLFEIGAADQVDLTIVVSATPEEQRARVMARGTMTEAQFETILQAQMPNEQKCAAADFVIKTHSLEEAKAGVQDVMQHISKHLEGLSDA